MKFALLRCDFFWGAFFAKFPNVLQKSLEIQRNVVSLHKIKKYEL